VLLNDFNSASGNSRSLVRIKEEGSQSFNKNRNYFFIYIGAIVYFFLAQVILCILKNSGANLVLAEMDCGERKKCMFRANGYLSLQSFTGRYFNANNSQIKTQVIGI
jgi:hypothetical protein